MNAGTVQVVLDGIALIAKLVGGEIASTAESVLTIVKSVVASMTKVVDGEISPEIVREEFAALAVKLAKNDQDANAALSKKFKWPPDPPTS